MQKHLPKHHPILKRINNLPKEGKLIGFFVMLIAILRIKLFFLQVIQSEEYQKDLIDIHATKSTLKAKR